MRIAQGRREKLIVVAFLVTVGLAFLLANRGAYGSFFQADDFDFLSWSTLRGIEPFVGWLVSPRVHHANFRPVGAYYYRVLGKTFGLNYAPFVAVLHSFHLLNIVLVFLILRTLKFKPAGIIAGVLFFAFHSATFGAYWEAKAVYDVLCGSFCLLTFLLYIRGHWLLGLVTFVFAYRSKELAVMLPLALAAYELLIAGRKWKPLLPYFVISLNFGIQALIMNRSHDDDAYTLHFSLATLMHSLGFYLSNILLVSYAGIVLLVLPFIMRMRQMYVGLVYMFAMLAPVLLLARHFNSLYWYVPLAGASMIIAGAASKEPRLLLTLLLVVWLPWNYQKLREWRQGALAASYNSRAYTAAVADLARKAPDLPVVLCIGIPFEPWGVAGVIRFSFKTWPKLYSEDTVATGTTEILQKPPVGVIWWSDYHRTAKSWLCSDPSCLRAPEDRADR